MPQVTSRSQRDPRSSAGPQPTEALPEGGREAERLKAGRGRLFLEFELVEPCGEIRDKLARHLNRLRLRVEGLRDGLLKLPALDLLRTKSGVRHVRIRVRDRCGRVQTRHAPNQPCAPRGKGAG